MSHLPDHAPARRLLRSSFNLCAAVLALILVCPRQISADSVVKDGKSVRITTSRDGEATHFYVQNDELCEVTMTFDLALVNLAGNVRFPYVMSVPANQKVEAFVLTPEDTSTGWDYSYTNYYKLGSNCASHDDSVVYQLPYAPGSKHLVTQGYDGCFSHKGSNRFAIDWKMPEGTLVYAARSGLVVKVKDDSNTGGSNVKYDAFNNFVLIRHDDGTLGHYCHLKKGGCLVKPGQRVISGEPIAHSGNTGFSSGPHLHFCVFRTRTGQERESIPVRFQTAAEGVVTLVEDRRYKATSVATPNLQRLTQAPLAAPLTLAHQ